MIEWYLAVAFILDNGLVVAGDRVEGWHARKQPSLSVCLDRMALAKQMPFPPGVKDIVWRCEARKVAGVDA
ncbi:MAG: hypothetical protein U5K75_05475 [Ahrensia sp.]|nr:hypothetical protein [Ahrensia sp.]